MINVYFIFHRIDSSQNDYDDFITKCVITYRAKHENKFCNRIKNVTNLGIRSRLKFRTFFRPHFWLPRLFHSVIGMRRRGPLVSVSDFNRMIAKRARVRTPSGTCRCFPEQDTLHLVLVGSRNGFQSVSISFKLHILLSIIFNLYKSEFVDWILYDLF